MSFHPDSNLPDCMMPDGGDCCAGHATVCEDWHKQRRRIEALEAALRRIDAINDNPAIFNKDIDDVCRAALERK
jgi:hypothetical protein